MWEMIVYISCRASKQTQLSQSFNKGNLSKIVTSTNKNILKYSYKYFNLKHKEFNLIHLTLMMNLGFKSIFESYPISSHTFPIFCLSCKYFFLHPSNHILTIKKGSFRQRENQIIMILSKQKFISFITFFVFGQKYYNKKLIKGRIFSKRVPIRKE